MTLYMMCNKSFVLMLCSFKSDLAPLTINCYQFDFNIAGSYVCSFNETQDLQSIDSATRIHIYVFDEVHLLTHSGEY